MSDYPPCMTSLGDDRFKCSKHGWVITATVLPIHCNLCSKPGESGDEQPPPIVVQAWNLAASLAAFVADGCRTVTKDEYERRLGVCDGCEHRDGSWCMKCGCYLPAKTRGRTWGCPIGKWGNKQTKRKCGEPRRRPPSQARPSGPVVAIVSRMLVARAGGEQSWNAIAETLQAAGFAVFGFVVDRHAPTGPARMPLVRVSADRMEPLLQVRPDVILCNPSEVPVIHSVATANAIPLVVYVQFWRGLLPVDPAILRHLDSDEIPAGAIDRANVDRIAGAAAVVANSEYTARQVERIVARPCEAVVEPYLGDVGLDGHPRKPSYVLLPSAQWGKGARRFFDLARRNPAIPFLLLAGDSMSAPAVVRAARSIGNVAVRTDWIKDMRAVWAGARALFIGTETCETFSRVAAEARACGVPILALRAGNLPNIVRDDGGVCVDRDATDDDWQSAFEKVLTMEPEPTTEFAQDHRARMVDVVDDVRRLSEVYMPLPSAPGIRAVVEHARRVLGVTVVPWDGPPERFAGANLIVCPWHVPKPILDLGVPTLWWWHSHCAQMDTSRRELTALADAWDLVAANPHLSIAFGHRAEAELWNRVHPGRSCHLPACLDCTETSVPKTGGVFVPGPYGPRKNVATALAACRRADQTAHVTGRIRSHPELLRFAVALGCRLEIHECPTVADVQAVAGACDVALMLSMAETYCYGAAECILAGTPVIGWRDLPVLATPDTQAWHVADPTDVDNVAAKIENADRAELARYLRGQLRVVKEMAARRADAARRTLLKYLTVRKGKV